MKNQISFLFIVAFSIFASTNLLAQKDTVINGVHYKVDKDKNPEFSKKHKRLTPLDSEYVVNNKTFRYYNKWFTLGGGVQQNLTYNRSLGFTGGSDLNFHIKRNYFQTGLELMGEGIGNYNNYQFHVGYGWRYEDKDVHFAAFIGPSFSLGYQIMDTVAGYLETRNYQEPGLYAQLEIIKKIANDVGIGASLFGDWNQEQTIVGLRCILYFSGSYRGKKQQNIQQ